MSFRIVFSIVFIPAWAAFAWWSWRAVRRRGFAPRYGMTLFGGGLMIFMALQQSLDWVNADLADAVGMPGFWKQVPLRIFSLLPIYVWGDFFFHRMLWSGLESMGIRPPPEA